MLVDQHNHWAVSRELRLTIAAVRSNDQKITNHGHSRGGAVEADFATSASRLDRVGCESHAVAYIVNLKVLKLANPGTFKKCLIYPARSFVMQICLRNSNSMELCLEQRLEHGGPMVVAAKWWARIAHCQLTSRSVVCCSLACEGRHKAAIWAIAARFIGRSAWINDFPDFDL